jgi:flagellar FliL protein
MAKKPKEPKGQPDAAEGEEKKGGGKKKIIIMVVVLLIGGVAAKFFIFKPEPAAAVPEVVELVEGEVIPVETFTINLGGADSHYGRIGFAVVLAEGANAEHAKVRLPILRDAALTILAGYTADELVSQEGMDHLREALSEQAKEILGEEEAIKVVLTEVLVQ